MTTSFQHADTSGRGRDTPEGVERSSPVSGGRGARCRLGSAQGVAPNGHSDQVAFKVLTDPGDVFS